MCGIMGFYCFSDKKPDKEKISSMFSLLESRGRDASGFAFIRDDNLIVNKAPVRSSEFVKSKDWQELELPEIMILHTRMKTQGSEKNPNNNHPLYNKEGIAIVHNGIIHNDHEIFGKNKPDGECDSEAILSVLSIKGKGDKIKKVFDRVEGSFAVAIINKAEPDTLILIKKDNPIDMYYQTDQDILYFCSEKEIMQEALGIQSESKRGFTIGEMGYHFYEMENNHALVINSEGVDSYKQYMARDFWSRRNAYRGSSLDTILVQCPWCLSQTRYFDGLLNNKCEQCGMKISEDELYNII
jgi:glucosamine 6-phosphate synthetase-like amidotransferase/phosphosugar isomerase protein